MKQEKGILGIRFFQLSYGVLLLLSIASVFISKQSDVFWIWIWLFYMPFLFFGVYLYGFVMGIVAQHRLKTTMKQLFCQAGLSFLLLLFLLLLSYLCLGGSFSSWQDLYYTFYPTLGSSLLFVLGSLLTKWMQKKTAILKNKQELEL